MSTPRTVLETAQTQRPQRPSPRIEGVVDEYNLVRGFGFLAGVNNSESFFAHHNEIQTQGLHALVPGQRVTFEPSPRVNQNVRAEAHRIAPRTPGMRVISETAELRTDETGLVRFDMLEADVPLFLNNGSPHLPPTEEGWGMYAYRLVKNQPPLQGFSTILGPDGKMGGTRILDHNGKVCAASVQNAHERRAVYNIGLGSYVFNARYIAAWDTLTINMSVIGAQYHPDGASWAVRQDLLDDLRLDRYSWLFSHEELMERVPKLKRGLFRKLSLPTVLASFLQKSPR